ncbi:MAG: hypothetical protein ACTSQL_03505 [Promethearchaeota archaeon]
MMYLCLASFLPILISLALIPGYSFELGLTMFVVTPVYLILMIITLKYIRKDIIAYGGRMGKKTARTGLIFLAVIPISVLILSPGFGFVLTGLDYIAFIFWGASSIINIIAAILYKEPKKNQST